ncbi:MAG: aldehyde ferredoxin oxidoreductase family protein [Desulfatibacillum sp.]|nr:aldehyde ferredoxin oxidoreductase family protein [Desulfatibacillum sp.]
MADAYMGQFLMVDLTRETTRAVPVPQWLKDQFVGGKGFGAKLLYDLVPPGTNPLGPENVLMFLTGPLTATAAPSMRACAVTRSPLTGTYLDSFFGGRFGPEIKYAGYDGIIIFGKASRPVYLWIKDSRVEIRPAKGIWGTSTLEANALIKKDIEEPEARVVTIGQAGENQVLFSLICCEYNRQAGRGGAGAVMGSKNLKGIAIKGSRIVKVHDLKAFDAACKGAYAEIAQSAACATYTDGGTSSAIPWSNEIGTLPYRNYKSQSDPQADKIGDEGQKKHLFLGKAACFACPIRCSQMGAVRTGKHSHFITDIVEYESAALLGSNLDIHDVRAVAHLTKLCDEYGLDSMSAGGVIGFAFEAANNGVIQSPPGVTLDFGNVQGAEYLIRSMALQENELGKLLSQGVKRASTALGGNTGDYAMHVKGLECPAWGPRGTPGMGLAYMTADRGACHQRGFMIGYDVGGDEYNGQPVEPYLTKGRAVILVELQNFIAGTDALVKCDFTTCGLSSETFAAMLSAATGKPVEADYFNIIGEKIWNQTRLYNVREGFLAKDDTLPRRFIKEVLPDGPHKGQRISQEDMDYMRRDYYRIRGWDKEGRPTSETLKKLGLDQAPDFMERP